MSIINFLNITATQRRKANGSGDAVEDWENVSTAFNCAIEPADKPESVSENAWLQTQITHDIYCLQTQKIKIGDKIIDGSTTIGNDIAFVDGGVGADTITCVGATFLTDGYAIGDIFVVAGSVKNDGEYTIVGVVAGTITLATGTLSVEAAGADITLTCGDSYLIKNFNKWASLYVGATPYYVIKASEVA